MTADERRVEIAARETEGDFGAGAGDQMSEETRRELGLAGVEAALRRAGQVARRRKAEVSMRNMVSAALPDIVQRVVSVAHPEKIVLFGSAVRNAMTPHSDIDLLVIKEGGDPDLSARIYEGLRGVRLAVDVIVVSPSDVERYKDSHALVIKPALQQGRVLYEST